MLLQCSSATISKARSPFRSPGKYIVFLDVARSPKRLWGIFIAVQIREQITSVRNSLLLSATAQPQRHETHWGEQRSAHREQHTVELRSPSCQCPNSTGRGLSPSATLLDLGPCHNAECSRLDGNLWTLAGANLNLRAEALITLLIRQFVWEHDQSHYP